MFKKILTFVATAAAACLAFSSCEKAENEPISIEFSKSLYTVYQKGSVDVVVRANRAVSEKVTVTVLLSGPAVWGTDYQVYADLVATADEDNVAKAEVTIEPGYSSAFLTVKDLGEQSGKIVNLKISDITPGYNLGNKAVTVVSPDLQEGYVASFSTLRAYAYESLAVQVSVTGSVTGKDFSPSTDLVIPLKLSGDTPSELQFVAPENAPEGATAPYAVIPAGETKAYVKFNVSDNCSGGGELQLTFDTETDSRVISGDNSYVNIAVCGLQTPNKLVGTWEFNKVYDLEELELWFAEMEDDTDALPTHNTGFTLTFTEEADGSVKLTPGKTGDFANFFRECTVTLSEPKNTTTGAITLGKYTVLDNQQFVTEDLGFAYQYNTYYKLSSANRAFSADTETLGEAVIVFRLTDDGLSVEFRDYDEPPFGEMWADGWSKFDPDMFSFASLFTLK